MDKRIHYVLKEAFFGFIWSLIVAALVFAPGIFSGRIEFVYANF